MAGFVYILMNKNNTVLYTGMSSDLCNRVNDHRQGCGSIFTAKYNVTKLVYFEFYKSIIDAIHREKQLKKWSRGKKMELIRKTNPMLCDLYEQVMLEFGY
jgi:putative endonuclease